MSYLYAGTLAMGRFGWQERNTLLIAVVFLYMFWGGTAPALVEPGVEWVTPQQLRDFLLSSGKPIVLTVWMLGLCLGTMYHAATRFGFSTMLMHNLRVSMLVVMIFWSGVLATTYAFTEVIAEGATVSIRQAKSSTAIPRP